ncbi:MAG: response regulator transcription factor, partial [Spirochaetales bacterium]|nr:response regulator transcription factor [Spirochaetales bacterium]
MDYKALIIEDDQDIAELISLYIKKDGAVAQIAGSAEEGFGLLDQHAYDVIVLDINLPGIDGFRFLKKMRTFSSVPVVIVSAREADLDIIKGFEDGADDFVTKPFSPAVLVERIKANVKRYRQKEEEFNKKIIFGEYSFNLKGNFVEYDGKKLNLAEKELDVLRFLLEHAGESVTVYDIFQHVWDNQYGDIATVSVHIQRLRKKLEKNLIETVYGEGYRIPSDKVK